MQKLSTSTGSLAASAGAQAIAIECTVTFVAVSAVGAAAVLSVYDGTSSSGVLLATIQAATNSSSAVPINIPVCANKGVFYVLTGAAATAVIHYVPGL